MDYNENERMAAEINNVANQNNDDNNNDDNNNDGLVASEF